MIERFFFWIGLIVVSGLGTAAALWFTFALLFVSIERAYRNGKFYFRFVEFNRWRAKYHPEDGTKERTGGEG